MLEWSGVVRCGYCSSARRAAEHFKLSLLRTRVVGGLFFDGLRFRKIAVAKLFFFDPARRVLQVGSDGTCLGAPMLTVETVGAGLLPSQTLFHELTKR